MSGLEIYSSEEPGFKPMVNFGAWRTAISNGPSEYKRKEVKSLSRHLETDEVFILVKGSGLLLTAGSADAPGEVKKTWMESGVMYNVTKATWHGTILLPGAKVMIVENRETGPENSESREIAEIISL